MELLQSCTVDMWAYTAHHELYVRQDINSLWPSDAIWGHKSWSTLAHVRACRLMAPQPLPELVLTYHQYSPMIFIWGHYCKMISKYQSVKQDGKLHFKIRARSPRNQWVKLSLTVASWVDATSLKLGLAPYTVRCHYNTVNVIKNILKR